MLLTLLTAAWLQYESPRYSLRTDLPEATAKKLLTTIENEVVDWSDIPQLKAMALPPRKRLMLIVFAQNATFDQVLAWKPENGLRLNVRPGLSGEDVTRVYVTADVLPNHFAQIAKVTMRSTLEDLVDGPPLWLTLGFEQYVSTAKREGEQWSLGTMPEFVQMTGEVPSLEQLTHVVDDFSLIGEIEKRRMEVCAWHLVHLLLHGTAQDPVSAESMTRLAAWLQALRNGEDPGQSLLRTSAPTDLPALYAADLNSTRLNVSRSPASTRSADGNGKPLPEGANRLPIALTVMPGAEGHIAKAFATDVVNVRREELKQAGDDPTVTAMLLKNELAETNTEDALCKAALPYASKLLSSPIPRHKQLGRKTIVGCKKTPPEPPVFWATAAKLKPPKLIEGDKAPALTSEQQSALKGQKGSIIAKLRIERDGKVSGVYIVTSALPKLNDAVVKTARGWRFQPTGNRYEFLAPFSFDIK